MSRVLRHLATWLGVWLAFYLMIRIDLGHASAMKISTQIMLAGPLPVYAHFVVLVRYFERRRYLQYALCLAAILAVSAVAAQLLHAVIDPDPNSHTNGLGIAVLFLTFSTGFRYFSRGMSQQYRLQEAESRQLQAELALLRSQVNPHFLFNILNSLYALSLERSQLLPDVILKLSGLMRFVVESSRLQTVPLASEIRFIEDFVELEKLRIEDADDVRLRVTGDPGERLIAPMLMVPFVENCFKHGLRADDRPPRIHVEIEISADRLRFTAENRREIDSHEPHAPREGLGIANVRQRLDLLYPQRHRLTIDELDDIHRVELSLWT